VSVLYVACRSCSVIVRLLVSRSPRRACRCTRAADGCSSSPGSSTGRCGRDRGGPSPFNYREDRTPTYGRGDPRGRDGGVREELAAGVVLRSGGRSAFGGKADLNLACGHVGL
jgi:hypothetical protein